MQLDSSHVWIIEALVVYICFSRLLETTFPEVIVSCSGIGLCIFATPAVEACQIVLVYNPTKSFLILVWREN